MPKAEWSVFFATAAGAAAALAGLAIVAISVNVARILSHPRLPARAAAATIRRADRRAGREPRRARAPVDGGPGHGGACVRPRRLAAPTVVGGEDRAGASRTPSAAAASAFPGISSLGQAQAAPVVIGGALLWAGQAGGLGWLAFGILATFTGAALNCWVLLVEILR